jgi:8-oxo-dGTP diphosphatase
MPTTGVEAGCADQPLETRRLRLRAPRLEDADAIARLLADGTVARFTARIPHPYRREDAQAFIGGLKTSDELVWVLTAKSDESVLGAIGLAHPEAPTGPALGYWLGRDHWGAGFMSEAVARVLRFAFEDLTAVKVRARAHPQNAASLRVLEKAGFVCTGSKTIDAPARGGTMAAEAWEITRAAWLRERALPVVLVAAVALVDADGRVLIARRPEGKALAGLWEFPGGKLRAGESPEAALVRELREELGIDTRGSCLAPIACASHAYEEFHLLMPLYVCRAWRGTIGAREGQELAWVRPARLADYPMPPADAPLVALLRDLL